jgi:fatty acid-binding protein DegV
VPCWQQSHSNTGKQRIVMVKVVAESTADIPAEMAAELGITIVPSFVMFDKQTYRDGVDLSRDEFYEKLAATSVIPTTATPPIGFYENIYNRLAEETDEIISIHLAERLSALYSVACAAAAGIDKVQIALVDSDQVTMGCGWLAVAILDTLEFLYRGGRVNWVQAMVGTLLRIKPIIEIRAGQVNLVERARTQARARHQLLDLIQDLGPLERAIIMHANAPSLAGQLADLLEEIDPGWERLIGHLGVTIASHAGPGAVGIACVTAY